MSHNKILFKQIYDRHFDEILSYLLWTLRDEDMAKDLIQSVFEALWMTIEKKTKPENPRSWLYRVCRNRLNDHYRDKQKLKLLINIEDDQLSEIKDCKQDVPSNFELKLMEEEIASVLASLDEPMRSIIYLIDVKKKSYREVTETVDLSERTVRDLRTKAWDIIELKLSSLSFPENMINGLPAGKRKAMQLASQEGKNGK